MPLTVTHNESEYYYHYNRHITWDEYKAASADAGGTTKSFPCYFKLYKDVTSYTITISPSTDDKTSNYFDTTLTISR